jgi:hypothetical protein
MGKLNIDELIGGLLESAIVAQRVSEQQHIINLNNFFNTDGTPKTTTMKIGSQVLLVPLFTLANLSSINIDELEVEFDAKIVVGDNKPSNIKKKLWGLFKHDEDVKHNIKSIEVDSGGSSTAKIKVKFKSCDKPEMVSRIVDMYVQRIDPTESHD